MTLTAKWVEGEEPEEVEAIGWLGGDPSNPTWAQYLARFGPEGRELVEAIREAHLRDHLDLYGEDMNNGYFALSDGRIFSCSWRAWGDLRQAIEDKREGYMQYYMRWGL